MAVFHLENIEVREKEIMLGLISGEEMREGLDLLTDPKQGEITISNGRRFTVRGIIYRTTDHILGKNVERAMIRTPEEFLRDKKSERYQITLSYEKI